MHCTKLRMPRRMPNRFVCNVFCTVASIGVQGECNAPQLGRFNIPDADTKVSNQEFVWASWKHSLLRKIIQDFRQ